MKNRSTQSDTNMNFDGMARETPGRVRGGLHVNHWSGHMNDGRDVNMGRGPTVAGRTGHKTPGSTGSVRDNINRGAQVRTPGGTRAWDPKCGQNYSGNPDQIRVGQSGGPAYGKTTRGSRPSTAAGSVDFNFGPKKQY